MLKWVKHPILKPPSDEVLLGMSAEEVMRAHKMYHGAIESARDNPLEFGFHPEVWDDVDGLFGKYDEVTVFGGNRSGKTTYGARSVVKAAMENEGALILCFSQDQDSSVRIQQKAVYEWLPSRLRSGVVSKSGYIKYSLKNGFTGESLIIPDTGSMIAFHTYTQYQNNPGKFEGIEVGSNDCGWVNLGIWLDEYLLGPDLINTLRFRLATRDACLLNTFTPIDGYTEFIAEYLKGIKTLERKTAEMLGNRQVPYIQESVTRNAGVIYFHSKWNPFGGYDRLKKDMSGRDEEEIMTRLYGLPVKMMSGQFPLFGKHHIMRHEDMMKYIESNDCTRYCICDPAPNKPWTFVWIAVDEDGRWYVYRDWPSRDYGAWAEYGKNKSRGGPAAKPNGFGIQDYVFTIKQCEEGEEIYERFIDPRMGASPKQLQEGYTTIIEQLEEHDMIFLPAPGVEETTGLGMLKDLMSYNTNKPVDILNRPMMYVSDMCEQTIDCIRNYSGSEGRTEAWKDFIDCLRYGAVAEICHISNLNFNTTRRSVGGY